MIGIINKWSTWKFILPTFLVTVGFSFFVFPAYKSKLTAIAGEVVQPLDTRFSYTAAEVFAAFEKLGVEGRAVYGFVVGCVDMIYPIAYGLLFILVMAGVLKQIVGHDSQWLLVSLLPVAGVLFDFLENFHTLKLLRSFPRLTDENVRWGVKMTQLKYGVLFFSAAVIVVLGIVWLVKTTVKSGRK
jgi:hypothetical protein